MSTPEAGLLVALVGNPNTGKSTLFNALTGLRQRVGNYPGVTVARKSGTCDLGDGPKVELVDLPGLYSLAAASPDEQVVIDALSGNIAGDRRPDAVVLVVDATNLLRNLFLASQVAELGRPVVVVLNQADVAKEQGLRIDTELLSRRLGGVPVVLSSAWKGEGILDVRRAIALAIAQQTQLKRVAWPTNIAAALADVAAAAAADTGKQISEADAQRLLFDTNPSTADRLGWTIAQREKTLRSARDRVRNSGYNPMAAEPLVHYAHLRIILEGVVIEGLGKAGRSAAVDRLLLHRFLGPVLFLGIMLGFFGSVFWLAKFPMEWIQSGVDWTKTIVAPLLDAYPMLQSLLADGIIGGVGAFLVFLPQILILFLFIGILEDSGYMARAAFIMDRLFSWCGLNGKSFVPLLSGFACAIPSLLSTRTIEDPKARLATAFVVPFMSCSARFPVYALMCAAFIDPLYGAGWQSVVMIGMHCVGLLFAVPTAFVLTRLVLKAKPQPFVLELPRYQMPKPRDVIWRMWQNAAEFVSKAGTVIFAITIIVWALSYFPRDASVAERIKAANPSASEEVVKAKLQAAYVEQSYMGRFGKAVQPVFDPLGFDWKITVGVLASFPAREVIVSTLGVTYSVGEGAEADSRQLRKAMQDAKWSEGPRAGTPIFSLAAVLALMVFFALCSQCGPTIATLAQETGGWKWAAGSFVYMTALAWVVAILVYQGVSRIS
ncbi:ferrous iron transport protein B [Verrucomicrobiota bacterium]|nr:ferrous iron transport protein B [Verrucomicrobiota bacterium]GDY18009.1 ferrous iron transport protein B [Verrucomicrobiota bacterium]